MYVWDQGFDDESTPSECKWLWNALLHLHSHIILVDEDACLTHGLSQRLSNVQTQWLVGITQVHANISMQLTFSLMEKLNYRLMETLTEKLPSSYLPSISLLDMVINRIHFHQNQSLQWINLKWVKPFLRNNFPICSIIMWTRWNP